MSKPWLKRLLHGVGGLLCVAGVWFVFTRLQSEVRAVEWIRLTPFVWVSLGVLAVLYGLANILLVRAWWNVMRFVSLNVGFGWAVRVYGLSQMAKYAPGNILHLAGRQALCMAVELPAAALGKASVLELALIASTGALYAAWCLPLLPLPVPISNPVAALVFVAGVVLFRLVLRRWVSHGLAAAMLWQLGFLGLSGAVFALGLYSVLSGSVAISVWPLVAGCYVVAWLAGFLTPGAPAGMGVREAVLLLLLGQWIPAADLVLAVILGRCVTIVGDLLFFAAAVTAGFFGMANKPANAFAPD